MLEMVLLVFVLFLCISPLCSPLAEDAWRHPSLEAAGVDHRRLDRPLGRPSRKGEDHVEPWPPHLYRVEGETWAESEGAA